MNVKAIYVKHWQLVVLTQVERNVIIKLLINCYSASYKAHDPTSYLLYLSADKFLEISNHAGCFTADIFQKEYHVKAEKPNTSISLC